MTHFNGLVFIYVLWKDLLVTELDIEGDTTLQISIYNLELYILRTIYFYVHA